MIISKAIEILKLHEANSALTQSPDLNDAIYLGAEALKRVFECRQHPFSPIYRPLPGETMPDRGIR